MIIQKIVLVASLQILATLAAPRATSCTISINQDLGNPQPLVLKSKFAYGHAAFYLPDSGDKINLAEGDVVRVACPGGKLIIADTTTSNDVDTATCKSGRFSINSQTVAFSSITCSTDPYHTARATGKTCLNKYKGLEIGFIVGNDFYKHMDLCFDESQDNTLYSEFNLTKTIGGYQSGFPRPSSFLQGNFYSMSGVNNLYTRNQQRITINNLVGLDESSYKYVAQSSDWYLARGHLTAKADFLYGSQHRATFHFINVAPQWQTFNGKNWMFLEGDVRDYASRTQQDLIVYTGTYGVTTLPHETTGKDVELYLYVNGNERRIPVPAVYWKVLYNPITKAGAVFLGVNNPYRVDMAKDIICEDICSQFTWLTWDQKNNDKGYGYCCSVDAFRKTVTTLPAFEVTQLLK